MPHKKAKRSVREEERRAKGSDLVPSSTHYSLQNEPIPKSIARVLNASMLRDSYNKKRKREDESSTNNQPKARMMDAESTKSSKKRKTEKETLQILPGESLGDFNRRVEDAMRADVRSAVRAGQANMRRQEATEKAERKDKLENQPSPVETNSTGKEVTKNVRTHPSTSQQPGAKPRKTDFESLDSRAPKRLNDIAQAPPDLSTLTAKADKLLAKDKKGEAFGKKDVVPPEQWRMMEIEREKAIKRYRELKERKVARGDKGLNPSLSMDHT